MGEDEGDDDIVCGALSAYDNLTRPMLVVLGEGEEEFSLCDMRVVARDGDFEATLSDGGSCNQFTMPDRFGTYEVTVEKAGYQTVVLSGVAVDHTPFGCSGPPEHDVKLVRVAQSCDGVTTRSLQVDLRDEAGAPICDARVAAIDGDYRWVFSSARTKEGTCVWGGPSERPGTYEVTVNRPGYKPLVVPLLVVPIDASGCHVVPAKVAPKMERSSAVCTAEVVESLVLNIRDTTNAIICDATVVVREGEFEATLVPVVEGNGCRWTGLPERSGTYEIEVEKPGYRGSLVSTTVEASACHVKPAKVSVGLTRL